MLISQEYAIKIIREYWAIKVIGENVDHLLDNPRFD